MISINHTMILPCPDGFQELDSAERSKFNSVGGPPEACLRDSDRHMIICAGHQKLPLFARAMLKGKEVASNMEKTISRAMAANDYKLIGFSERMVGGKSGNCFRYVYVAESIPMAGEACFIRSGSTLYNLFVYYRQSSEPESLSVWDFFLESVKW